MAVNLRDERFLDKVATEQAARGLKKLAPVVKELVEERLAELHTGRFIPRPASRPHRKARVA